ncbi:unnamed protein product [Phytophthora fragariaefolia]|uniref:Unnamed protein product n=1 Tax=Phytophthora fragariaefolia TaxID=1490495 RepID=A0A9W7CS13_9STRA|nr:unnamed protein product [Phytophthora fragariaefolia]
MPFVCVLQMAKLTGSSNYKANEVRRLLALVDKYLPLGKDEWERHVSHFNAYRGRGVSERDYESLQRKFKVLYRTRKPTGVQEMPHHIKEAKPLKKTTDDKANVVIMDDGGDEDEEEQHDKQLDFCFEFDGDESFDHETCTDDRAAFSGTGGDYGTSAEFTSGSTVTDDSGRCDETFGFGTNSIGTPATHLADRGSDFSDLLDPAAVNEGLEAFASTPCPAPVTMRSSPCLRSAGLTKTAKTPPVADLRSQRRRVMHLAPTRRQGVGSIREAKRALARATNRKHSAIQGLPAPPADWEREAWPTSAIQSAASVRARRTNC